MVSSLKPKRGGEEVFKNKLKCFRKKAKSIVCVQHIQNIISFHTIKFSSWKVLSRIVYEEISIFQVDWWRLDNSILYL